MENAVGVALVAGAHVVVVLRLRPTLCLGGLLRLRGQKLVFLLLHPFAHVHKTPPCLVRIPVIFEFPVEFA